MLDFGLRGSNVVCFKEYSGGQVTDPTVPTTVSNTMSMNTSYAKLVLNEGMVLLSFFDPNIL